MFDANGAASQRHILGRFENITVKQDVDLLIGLTWSHQKNVSCGQIY